MPQPQMQPAPQHAAAGMYAAPAFSAVQAHAHVPPPTKKIPSWLRDMLLKKQSEQAAAGAAG